MLIDLIFATKFYFLTLFISLIFFPVTSIIFRKFYDRGYAAARLIGIITISYFSWIFAHTGVLPFTSKTIWLIVVLIGTASIYYYIYNKSYKRLASVYGFVIGNELLYLTSFSAMLLLRGEIPRIEGIEKFMDYAILNSLLRTDFLPLQDVWYSGHSINYYYFGQYIIAALLKLTQIPSNYGYNLAIGFIFANVCTLTFWIAKNLTKSNILSTACLFLLAIGGNLDHIYKIFILKNSSYFYAEARSLIEFTINEFPAYSFLIGDLHAHILNIAHVLIYIAFLAHIFLNKQVRRLDLIVMGFWLGILYTTNSWDFIMYFGLTFIVLSVIKLNEGLNLNIILRIFLESTLILVVFGVLFIPFFMYFKPAVNGIGMVHAPHSPIFKIFIMFGFFLFLCLPYLAKVREIILNLKSNLKLNSTLFGLIIFVYACTLIVTPDIIYVKDIYHQTTPDYYRANTVFKVWYQAWILLSFASVLAIKILTDYLPLKKLRNTATLFITCLIVIVVGSYMKISVNYLIGPTYAFDTLDGKDYLNDSFKDENILIDWMNTHISGQHVLLEADGDSYSMQSIFSSYTGLASVVGWTNHEFGWRNNWPVLSLRLGDIKIMYTSDDQKEVQTLLDKYNIEYVVVGRFEREKFGQLAGQTITSIGVLIREENGLQLYYIPQQR